MGNAKSTCPSAEPHGARYWSSGACIAFTEHACHVVDGHWVVGKGWYREPYCEGARRYVESGGPLVHWHGNPWEGRGDEEVVRVEDGVVEGEGG